MNPFQSLSDYEAFAYTIQQNYPSITRSTLVIARRTQGVAILSGELHFEGGLRFDAPNLPFLIEEMEAFMRHRG